MNNYENVERELSELLDEKLIKCFKFIQSDINVLQFEITTLEGKKLVVETSINYCFNIINKEEGNQRLYETMESLLRENSESYEEKFAYILSEKLQALVGNINQY